MAVLRTSPKALRTLLAHGHPSRGLWRNLYCVPRTQPDTFSLCILHMHDAVLEASIPTLGTLSTFFDISNSEVPAPRGAIICQNRVSSCGQLLFSTPWHTQLDKPHSYHTAFKLSLSLALTVRKIVWKVEHHCGTLGVQQNSPDLICEGGDFTNARSHPLSHISHFTSE